ncbi:GEVED domain-containing protein [Nonomuraea sp. NPDC049152]|uniref:GEVED domain-containing protein n=1 Tax=Nonomuraea sp. NPDC049152 TaxID=3154350 RepID=UPI0033D8D585
MTAAFVGAAGIVPLAYAGGSPAAFINSSTEATGDTPSGVLVTIRKTMLNGTRVGSARVSPSDPAAPADEYLSPVNAKADAGIIDRYEDFRVNVNGWSDVAELTFTFSRPVRDPRLHVFGTGGAAEDAFGRRDDYWAGVELVGGAPTMPRFSNAAGFPGYVVTDTTIAPERVTRTTPTTCGVVYTCGTVQVNGTITSFTIRLRARNVRTLGDAGGAHLWGAFKLSLYEDDSDAPTSYGAATHTITDAFIGQDTTADNVDTLSFDPRALRQNSDTDDALPQGTSLGLQGNATTYSLIVPVRARSAAELAGWIDFDRNGRFDAEERAHAQVEHGADFERLTWNVPSTVVPGSTWLRLRMAATSAGVEQPTGWADSGEVEDYPFGLARREAVTPKAEPPTIEPPTAEPPMVEPPRVSPPRAEPPRISPPTVERPRQERPREDDRSRADRRRPDADRPKREIPKPDKPARGGVRRDHDDRHKRAEGRDNRADSRREQDDEAKRRRADAEAKARRERADAEAKARRERADADAAARRERADADAAARRERAEADPRARSLDSPWEQSELTPPSDTEYTPFLDTEEIPDY